ncbi:MAG: histidine phosphatase family protein, partial [Ruminococcus sp.]|nr:histidine phosphatase family protein [Ruminococcus sp.]
MKINFIRHGMTAGNEMKKYIGTTDEELSEKGISIIKSIQYPDCDTLIVSPMKRCIQTAKIIYPDKNYIICEDFRECDFGDFEGKNYIEL